MHIAKRQLRMHVLCYLFSIPLLFTNAIEAVFDIFDFYLKKNPPIVGIEENIFYHLSHCSSLVVGHKHGSTAKRSDYAYENNHCHCALQGCVVYGYNK